MAMISYQGSANKVLRLLLTTMDGFICQSIEIECLFYRRRCSNEHLYAGGVSTNSSSWAIEGVISVPTIASLYYYQCLPTPCQIYRDELTWYIGLQPKNSIIGIYLIHSLISICCVHLRAHDSERSVPGLYDNSYFSVVNTVLPWIW